MNPAHLPNPGELPLEGGKGCGSRRVTRLSGACRMKNAQYYPNACRRVRSVQDRLGPTGSQPNAGPVPAGSRLRDARAVKRNAGVRRVREWLGPAGIATTPLYHQRGARPKEQTREGVGQDDGRAFRAVPADRAGAVRVRDVRTGLRIAVAQRQDGAGQTFAVAATMETAGASVAAPRRSGIAAAGRCRVARSSEHVGRSPCSARSPADPVRRNACGIVHNRWGRSPRRVRPFARPCCFLILQRVCSPQVGQTDGIHAIPLDEERLGGGSRRRKHVETQPQGGSIARPRHLSSALAWPVREQAGRCAGVRARR